MEMDVDGNNLRRIARHLKVTPQTVACEVTDVAEALPEIPLPNKVKEAEMDEMFTFISEKRRTLHSLLTLVDRKTRCILSWAVVWVHTQATLQ